MGGERQREGEGIGEDHRRCWASLLRCSLIYLLAGLLGHTSAQCYHVHSAWQEYMIFTHACACIVSIWCLWVVGCKGCGLHGMHIIHLLKRGQALILHTAWIRNRKCPCSWHQMLT